MLQNDRPLILAMHGPNQSLSWPRDLPDIRLLSTNLDSEFAGHLAEADAIVFWEFRGSVLQENWSKELRLDWVHVAGAGVDDILFPELVRSRVTLTNSRGVFDLPVAEYAISLMAAICKQIPRTIHLQHEGRWSHRQSGILSGSRLLIVGVGGIGQAIARLAGGLGMVTIGIGLTERDGIAHFDEFHSVAELHQQVALADHVVVALPLTQATNHLFDAATLQAFQGASLVNVGRGKVIDEVALLAALDGGYVNGAALDVFCQEPLPRESPLWSHPQLLVSPHMAGDVPGIQESLIELWVDNLGRWLRGESLVNVVDKQRGYVVAAPTV